MRRNGVSTAVRHVVLGNPENRRIAFFQDALDRLGLPPARVVSYRDLLDAMLPVDTLFEQSDFLRIESPGEDFEVEKRLIARGADHPDPLGCERISRSVAMALEPDHGRLRFTRQRYFGYCDLLREIEAAYMRRRSAKLYNSPKDIQVMFDKPLCQRHLRQKGVPVPEILTGLRNYDQLASQARERKWNRVFVKLANGSSASGVVALHLTDDGVRAVTPIEMVKQHGSILFYNNLQLRTYTDADDVRTIVDYLCAESAQVERWMPKAALAGRTFDLRLLVIGGMAQHAVVRTSTSPLTNLHLGNRRGNLNQLIQKLGDTRWQQIQEVACRAASVFPSSLYVGVDLLLAPNLRSELILELNAFGDLLPGVKFADHDAYEAEILAQGARQHR